jgi:fatty acid/phospholipid biosynthesis enzyme
LQQSPVNFVGNVEGRDIFRGGVDVVVCDGFVGNVVLKFSESVIHLMKHLVKEEIGDGLRNKLGALLLRPVFKSLSQQLNYEEYGGAPLLGVDGVVITLTEPLRARSPARCGSPSVSARERINDLIATSSRNRTLGISA